MLVQLSLCHHIVGFLKTHDAAQMLRSPQIIMSGGLVVEVQTHNDEMSGFEPSWGRTRAVSGFFLAVLLFDR